MGVFGTGLYSGDFALDLRGTIRAVSRLPFDADALLQILREAEPTAADNLADEDHTIFWLVVADQFAKRGIDSLTARTKALDIIQSGADLAMFEKLGAKPPDLRKRGTMLEELRMRLLAPLTIKPRTTLKKPQPLLMEIGDVLIYPTCLGHNINPYYAHKELQTHWVKDQGSLPWKQDGWGAVVILDRGRAFDFLAWYLPLTVAWATTDKPTIDTLRGDVLWKLENPCTCSALHYARIEFEKIGSYPVDANKLQARFPNLRPGTYAAVNDISIGNRLHVVPSFNPRMLAAPDEAPAATKWKTRTMQGIQQILG